MTESQAPSHGNASVHQVFQRVQEEAKKSRMYFHTWWGLVNRALPEHASTINDWTYVDFFHAVNFGFFELIFVSLSKLFDRTKSGNREALGLHGFREVLEQAGHAKEAQLIEQRLSPKAGLIKRIRSIRNRIISHNEAALTREAVFKQYGITPDEIRELVHDICDVLNEVGRRIDHQGGIPDGERSERAVIALLETLRRGKSR